VNGQREGERASMRQPLVIRRGRYELVLPLGEGRLTRVYLAVADGATAPVVVKRLRPELAQQAQLCANFTAAAHLGMRLHHPQIAKTHEVFSEGDEQLVAMEYLEGHTLLDLVRRVGRARMPLEEHLYVLSLALAGLAHCHALIGPDGRPNGGNHREASASNIVITYDGAVKLVDFALQEVQGPVPGVRMRGGQGIGPFAPEQLCGLPLDARCDVFAMGVLLWEALARRPRAVGDDPAALIAARVAGSEPGPEALPPGLPRELVEICARATELDPAGRFATPAEMAVALDRVRAGFSRSVGAADLALLVSRNFKLDRDALRRRINQHLEDSRAAIRLRTPPVLLVATPPPKRPSRELTVPGVVPGWFEDSGAHAHAPESASDDHLPAVPVPGRRLGLALFGIAAAAVVATVISFVPKRDAPAERADLAAGSARPLQIEPAAPPSAPPPVAVDRVVDRGGDRAGGHAVPPAVRPPAGTEVMVVSATLPKPAAATKQAEAATAATATTTTTTTTPATATARARAKRASAAPGSSLATSADLVRTTPVPLLDMHGGLLSVPRPPAQGAPPSFAETPGRGPSAPARRQLDEQDPYR
jgi:serine/threonine protein kinase